MQVILNVNNELKRLHASVVETAVEHLVFLITVGKLYGSLTWFMEFKLCYSSSLRITLN